MPKTVHPHVLEFQHPSIQQVPVALLVQPEKLFRTHNRAQKRKLKAILRRLGFIDPLVVDEHFKVLAGVLRLQVAMELGLETVPVIKINHLGELEKRAYVLVANRLAEDAGWDRSLLAMELGELAIMLPESGIDLETTGFDISEFDRIILDSEVSPGGGPEDTLPVSSRAVSRVGDLWVCHKSRVFCADALQPGSYARLMAGQLATMTFTDPPYNVSIAKHARGRARSKQKEFASASGEMTDAEFLHFLITILELIARSCSDGAIVFSCIDWAHVRIMLDAGEAVHLKLKNICVWVKSNGGMGTFYRSRHELVCAFKVGTEPHINTFELGQHGRSRTNVWEYAGLNAFKSGRDDELAMHPTVKPVRMIADAMLDCSKPGSIVLDPFIGSGSTLIAGEMVGRGVFGLEIDPSYIDVTIRRWQAFTGRDAILEATGQTFNEVEAERNPRPSQDFPQNAAHRQRGLRS
jgi:DNA modification methylase